MQEHSGAPEMPSSTASQPYLLLIFQMSGTWDVYSEAWSSHKHWWLIQQEELNGRKHRDSVATAQMTSVISAVKLYSSHNVHNM